MEGKSYFSSHSRGSRLGCCQLGTLARNDELTARTNNMVSSHESSMPAQTKSISYNRLDGCRGHQAWLDSGNTSVRWSVGDSRNISISTDRQTIKNAQDPDAFLNNEFHLSRACVLQDLLHDRTRPRCKRLSVHISYRPASCWSADRGLVRPERSG